MELQTCGICGAGIDPGVLKVELENFIKGKKCGGEVWNWKSGSVRLCHQISTAKGGSN